MQRLFFGIAALWIGISTLSVAAQPDIKGFWLTQKEERNAKIEITNCSTSSKELCGKIVWLQSPTYPDGKPKIDKHNPDSALQNRPLLNLEILKGFTSTEAGVWENGTIYNPEDGETYSCTIRLSQDETGKEILEVHGYIGIELLGKTQYWKRTPQ